MRSPVKDRKRASTRKPIVDGDTVRVPLTQDKVAIVDTEDLTFVSGRAWVAVRYGGRWYAKTNVCCNSGTWTAVYLHRVLMRDLGGRQVDHINGDGLDNRRCNLRSVSSAENKYNAGKRKDNSSGYKGVSCRAGGKRWRAQIQHCGRTHWLGVYDNKIDAARAYNAAALQMFGAFARLNHVR